MCFILSVSSSRSLAGSDSVDMNRSSRLGVAAFSKNRSLWLDMAVSPRTSRVIEVIHDMPLKAASGSGIGDPWTISSGNTIRGLCIERPPSWYRYPASSFPAGSRMMSTQSGRSRCQRRGSAWYK